MEQASQPDVTVHCPVVFGSMAYWLGKKADESATHQWTLFVRGPHNEDLSYFLQSVTFTLHESFAQPVREITVPPYEVTENGWGEFEARIKLNFRDPSQEPIEVTHPIKLYPSGNTAPNMKKPVVHEVYDEVVFYNPSGEAFDEMSSNAGNFLPPHPQQEHWTRHSDVEDLQKLAAAREFIRKEIEVAKDELSSVEAEQQFLRDQISERTGRKPPAPR